MPTLIYSASLVELRRAAKAGQPRLGCAPWGHACRGIKNSTQTDEATGVAEKQVVPIPLDLEHPDTAPAHAKGQEPSRDRRSEIFTSPD